MYIALVIIYITSTVFANNDTKYIDLLPEKEKEEFLERIARRILADVKAKENKGVPDVPKEELDLHGDYVQKIINEEVESSSQKNIDKQFEVKPLEKKIDNFAGNEKRRTRRNDLGIDSSSDIEINPKKNFNASGEKGENGEKSVTLIENFDATVELETGQEESEEIETTVKEIEVETVTETVLPKKSVPTFTDSDEATRVTREWGSTQPIYEIRDDDDVNLTVNNKTVVQTIKPGTFQNKSITDTDKTAASDEAIEPASTETIVTSKEAVITTEPTTIASANSRAFKSNVSVNNDTELFNNTKEENKEDFVTVTEIIENISNTTEIIQNIENNTTVVSEIVINDTTIADIFDKNDLNTTADSFNDDAPYPTIIVTNTSKITVTGIYLENYENFTQSDDNLKEDYLENNSSLNIDGVKTTDSEILVNNTEEIKVTEKYVQNDKNLTPSSEINVTEHILKNDDIKLDKNVTASSENNYTEKKILKSADVETMDSKFLVNNIEEIKVTENFMKTDKKVTASSEIMYTEKNNLNNDDDKTSDSKILVNNIDEIKVTQKNVKKVTPSNENNVIETNLKNHSIIDEVKTTDSKILVNNTEEIQVTEKYITIDTAVTPKEIIARSGNLNDSKIINIIPTKFQINNFKITPPTETTEESIKRKRSTTINNEKRGIIEFVTIVTTEKPEPLTTPAKLKTSALEKYEKHIKSAHEIDNKPTILKTNENTVINDEKDIFIAKQLMKILNDNKNSEPVKKSRGSGENVPKSFYEMNKGKTHEVFEVAPNENPYVEVKTKDNYNKNNEQPHFVPIYEYSLKNAYYNAYNRYGPNEDDLTRTRPADDDVNEEFHRDYYIPDDEENRKFQFGINSEAKQLYKPIKVKSPTPSKNSKVTDIYVGYGTDYDIIDIGRRDIGNSDDGDHLDDQPENIEDKEHKNRDTLSSIRQLFYANKNFNVDDDGSAPYSSLSLRTKGETEQKEGIKVPDVDNIAVDYYFGRSQRETIDGKNQGKKIESGKIKIRKIGSKNKTRVVTKTKSTRLRTAQRVNLMSAKNRYVKNNTRKDNANKQLNVTGLKEIMSMNEAVDLLPTLTKLLDSDLVKFHTFRRSSSIDIYSDVLQDLLESDDKALQKFDWLKTSVSVLATLNKLEDLIDKILSRVYITPSDFQLISYVTYLHKSAIHYVAESLLVEEDLRKRKILPKNKKKKQGIIKDKGLMNRVWLYRMLKDSADPLINDNNILDLKEFLATLQSNLFSLYTAILYVAKITRYDNQHWYENLKDVYITTSRQKLLEVLTHLTASRLVDLIQFAAENGAVTNYADYIKRNNGNVEVTKKEFIFLIKLLDELDSIEVNK